jgi:hypothetical protein
MEQTEPMEQLALKVYKASQVQLGLQVLMEPMAPMEQLAHKEFRVTLDLLG